MAFTYTKSYLSLASMTDRMLHQSAKLQSLLAGCFVAVVVGYAMFTGNGPFMGIVSSSMAVAMFGSPLAVIRDVIKRKTAAALSYGTAMAMVIATVSWTLYGTLIVNDYNVYIPNGIGAMLALTQLYLIAKYPDKRGAFVSLDELPRTI